MHKITAGAPSSVPVRAPDLVSAAAPLTALTALGFEQACRRSLHAAPPLTAVSPQSHPVARPQALKPAAVLVPIVDRPGGATVLFTERASTLRSHSGQIAFPGGQIDGIDDGALGAALREAEEEVGLAAHYVEPLGYLDLVLTGTGYRITPVVAMVQPGFRLRLNPAEVAGAFECPLAFLMDPAHHRIEQRVLNGESHDVYAMPFGGHRIWGITAGIVRNLYERVSGS